MPFFEVSAKLGGDNIDKAFGTLLRDIIKNAFSFEAAAGSSTMKRREAAPIKLRKADQNADVDKKKTSCCATTK